MLFPIIPEKWDIDEIVEGVSACSGEINKLYQQSR